MNVTVRLAAAISAVFALVLVAASLLFVTGERRFLEEEMDLHGRLLGRVVASMVEETRLERGEQAARELLREIDRHEQRISVRWVDPAAAEGSPGSSPALDEETRAQLRSGEVVGNVSPEDDNTLYTYVPLPGDESRQVIEIAESLQHQREHLSQSLLRVLALTAAGVALSSLCAFLLGRRLVGRPVRELTAQARRVGTGDLTASAPETMRHELGTLAREMNQMARNLAAAREHAAEEESARREIEARLQHADKLATVGRLAAGIAHEIATPLQAITLRAELMAGGARDERVMEEDVNRIKEQAAYIMTITRGLLRFSRKEEPRRDREDLRDVVQRSISLVGTLRTRGSVEIVRELPDVPAAAVVDAEQLIQVLTNLLVNASQAMPDGGHILVSLARRGDFFCISVEDEGAGIPADILPHLFEPFFTTKTAGEGTGLGLSIAYGIVEQHGGWIDVDSEPGRGSRFSVYLPAEEA